MCTLLAIGFQVICFQNHLNTGEKLRLTRCLRRTHNALRTQFKLSLVFKVQWFRLGGWRCSPLNAALALRIMQQGGFMFPLEVFVTYTLACLLLVISPGPDNLLAIGRGLSQGRLAAVMSGMSSGAGILFHVVAATFGLTLLIQTSEVAFYVVKLVGAAYLIWLGVKVLRSRNLFSLEPAKKQSLKVIFSTGFLSAALNPKPGMFVLAFVPQFVNPSLGSVTTQMIGYGVWFAVLTAVGFSLMGVFSSQLSEWFRNKPKLVSGLNIGAGITFVSSGLAVAFMKQR